MNNSEKTQSQLAQKINEQALQEQFPALEEEQLAEVTGGMMDPGSPDVYKTSYQKYVNQFPFDDTIAARKRTAAEAGLPSYQSIPRKAPRIG